MPFAEINTFRLLDYLRLDEVAGAGYFGRQAEPVLGAEHQRRRCCSATMPSRSGCCASIRRSRCTFRACQRCCGSFRWDNFFGQLSGHDQFPAGPYIYGNKLSFKPFARYSWGMGGHHPFQGIEISFARTNVFAGQNHVPLTFGSFWNSFSSTGAVPLDVKFSRNDPGARFASFDFSWQILAVDQHLHRHVHA